MTKALWIKIGVSILACERILSLGLSYSFPTFKHYFKVSLSFFKEQTLEIG